MNAAAKVINQSSLFTGPWTDMRLSKQLCFQIALSLAVLISALAVVYMTNLHRITFNQLQVVQFQGQQLQLQWGQLLLEQASLATPARVEQMAQEQLHMVLPNNQQTIMLRIQ
ncbi:MAG: cell division protein FtsL [Legionellales bacterium]|nr:cell division protein FtsL [Legionellales bacterium]